MMIMGYFKKIYVGALEDEKEAALLYDKIALLIHGIKAKTNFNYNKREIKTILTEFDV